MRLLTTAFSLALLQVALAGPVEEARNMKKVLEAREDGCLAYPGVSYLGYCNLKLLGGTNTYFRLAKDPLMIALFLIILEDIFHVLPIV